MEGGGEGPKECEGARTCSQKSIRESVRKNQTAKAEGEEEAEETMEAEGEL
jgi:hypothetical protein